MNSLDKIPNRNILLVDDESDILHIMEIYLSSLNWHITTSPSPLEALKHLEATPYFLIITDIAMPYMDGYEFIQEVKQRAIPSEIAIMTGFGYNPDHSLVKINKEFHYPIFFKPFEFKKDKIKDSVTEAYNHYHDDLVKK